jgi:uncharacterized protein YbjT (DUF2867 family)
MILVTGGTGTTGRQLVRLLQEAGLPYRVLSRNKKRARTVLGDDAVIVEGDLNDPESLDEAFDGARKLFLLTATDPHQVEQEAHALEMAEAAGVARIVKVSVLGADENSPVSLGRWHAFSERQLLESSIASTILRPHYFMSNTLQFAPHIATHGSFALPLRDGHIGMIDVRDVAAVALQALTTDEHVGRVYDLTGAESLGFAEVATILREELGRPVQYIDVPPSDAEKFLLEAGVPSWLADALLSLYGIFAAGHASECTYAVQDITGRPPRSYRDFVRDHASAFGLG